MIHRPQKLQLSLTIQFTALFILIAAFIYYYFSQKFEEEALEKFKFKTEIIKKYFQQNSHLISYTKIENTDRLNELLQLADADYFVLEDEKGNIINSVNIEFAEFCNYSVTSDIKELPTDETVLRVVLPVVIGHNRTGNIYVGFKSRMIAFELKKKTLLTALFCLSILLAGIVFTYFLSSFSFKPVTKLTSALNSKDREEQKFLLTKFKNNEVGILAEKIHEILNELDNSSNRLSHLSEKLNGVFREKMYEVGFEINQRKKTESHLRKSEELFKLLFENAPIGMIIISEDGTAIRTNKAFCKTVAYEWHEIVGANIKYIFGGNDSENEKSIFQLITDNESLDTECNLIRKDGRRIAAILKTIKISNDKGELKNVLIQVLDITQIKNAQGELVSALDKAKESDRLKSAFLAQMSHEIRTPLNVILPSIPIIAEELGNKDEEILSILASVENASKRLQNTIDMILSMSAVQSGNYKPRFEKFNLAADLKTLSKEFISVTKESGLQLFFSNSSSSSEISADRYTVNQIFQNLIGNAVKYTHTGHISVSIEDYQKNKLIVKIEDTGIGISPKYIKNLFTPFSQEDSGRTRKYEGNGLGLALVKEYVKINRGEITVKSEKNVGSTFSVIFEKTIQPSSLENQSAFLKELKTLLN